MTDGGRCEPGLPDAVRRVAPAVLDLLGRHGSDAVLIVDEAHTVLWANARAGDALDRPSPPRPDPAPGGLSLRRWVRDPALAVAVGRAFHEGTTIDEEVRLAAGQRSYRGIVVPLTATGGDRLALVVLRDDTAARRLTRAHQDLLANLSHDLRTPLAGLRLLAETLVGEARNDREATVAFAERIAVEAERLHELVSGILDLAHLEADVDRASIEPIPLGPVVERVVERLRPLAREGGVTVRLAMDEVSAIADPARLEVALGNILDNAIKFTSRGGGGGGDRRPHPGHAGADRAGHRLRDPAGRAAPNLRAFLHRGSEPGRSQLGAGTADRPPRGGVAGRAGGGPQRGGGGDHRRDPVASGPVRPRRGRSRPGRGPWSTISTMRRRRRACRR